VLGITGVRHVCLVVENYEEMLDFYIRIMGFQLKSKTQYDSKALKNGLGIKNVKVFTSLLKLPDSDLEIEITHYDSVNNKYSELNVNDCGYRHIAFFVNDIESAYNRVKNLQLNSVSEPIYIKRADGVRLKFFYFQDPEGNFIELNEII